MTKRNNESSQLPKPTWLKVSVGIVFIALVITAALVLQAEMDREAAIERERTNPAIPFRISDVQDQFTNNSITDFQWEVMNTKLKALYMLESEYSTGRDYYLPVLNFNRDHYLHLWSTSGKYYDAWFKLQSFGHQLIQLDPKPPTDCGSRFEVWQEFHGEISVHYWEFKRTNFLGQEYVEKEAAYWELPVLRLKPRAEAKDIVIIAYGSNGTIIRTTTLAEGLKARPDAFHMKPDIYWPVDQDLTFAFEARLTKFNTAWGEGTMSLVDSAPGEMTFHGHFLTAWIAINNTNEGRLLAQNPQLCPISRSWFDKTQNISTFYIPLMGLSFSEQIFAGAPFTYFSFQLPSPQALGEKTGLGIAVWFADLQDLTKLSDYGLDTGFPPQNSGLQGILGRGFGSWYRLANETLWYPSGEVTYITVNRQELAPPLPP